MIQEFWVVGGRYRDARFADLQEGSGEVYGPFPSYGEALAAWRTHGNDAGAGDDALHHRGHRRAEAAA